MLQGVRCCRKEEQQVSNIGEKSPYRSLTWKRDEGKLFNSQVAKLSPTRQERWYEVARALQSPKSFYGAIAYAVNCLAPPTYTCPLATVGPVNLIAVAAVSRVP